VSATQTLRTVSSWLMDTAAPDFAPADPIEPPASDLLAAMTEEMRSLYGQLDRLDRPHLDPADLSGPGGVYLVGWVGGQAVAGGGVRRLGPGLGEIKRMYVRPEYRSQGVAGALLGALERGARALGYRTVRLDTGPLQPHARRLYERAGYVEVPPYNDNPYAAFWGEKHLDPVPDGPQGAVPD
jgi:GNAT superfamily N-acetyltransferase